MEALARALVKQVLRSSASPLGLTSDPVETPCDVVPLQNGTTH